MAVSFSTEVLRQAAHDLKNPLTAVRVLADLLAEDADGPLRADLHDMIAALDRAVVQAEGLSSWAHALDGDVPLGADASLRAVLDEVASREAFERVVVVGRSSDVVASAWARRAFTSLLATCTQLSRGHVELALHPGTVRVGHPGVALRDEQVEALFRPTVQRMVRGTAFGLWAARDLFAAAGGTLDCVETDPFTLEIGLPAGSG
jgi:signal transduction histidine kinase